MRALEAAYSQRGPGRLFWCGRGDGEISDSVTRLLQIARSNGRLAYYVPTHGFDDLLVRLANHALRDERKAKAEGFTKRFLADLQQAPPSFAVRTGRTKALLRSNALSVDLPKEIQQFKCAFARQPGAWQNLRDLINGKQVVAGLLRQRVLALGRVEDIDDAFSWHIEGATQPVPLGEGDLHTDDSVVASILSEALIRSIAAACDLMTDGRRLVWENVAGSRERVSNILCVVHDAAHLSLRTYSGKTYLVVKPTIVGRTADGKELADDIDKELKRQLLTKQYNRQFNDAVTNWVRRIFGKAGTSFEFPHGSGSGIWFKVQPAPVLAVVTDGSGKESQLPQKVQPLVRARGIQVREPELLFSNGAASGKVRDSHPLRGIVSNQPYDFPLTRSGVSPSVQLGVLCPKSDAQRLYSQLQNLNQRHGVQWKKEYILEYPGFSSAFGVPLEIPRPGTAGWIDCPEPSRGTDVQSGARDLRQIIGHGVQSLAAGYRPSVTLIYIPKRWAPWEGYRTNHEVFDLHDYVKAKCVQLGVPTQFLREQTFLKPHKCEICWWIGLSLYVKSMRTPWILDGMDQNTAFVGIGYSHDRAAERGKHIILGCSHLFGSNGQSLNYQLSKLEDVEWRRRNPHMSREDARRTGETVRQLFHESLLRTPSRVVIHKHTPFLQDEKLGLLEGLHGVADVDMIEIRIDRTLRYVTAQLGSDGKPSVDSYPVRRGTVVVLDSQRALIWVHGTTDAVVPPDQYYQGKSRIPAPLMLIRHHGRSDLNTLATEVLGFSKMNWNTFDMYTKEPATIASSNDIARIGALLDRLSPRSYDYRLFI